MSTPLLLTSNPGSSTIKIGLNSVLDSAASRIAHGLIDLRHQPLWYLVTIQEIGRIAVGAPR